MNKKLTRESGLAVLTGLTCLGTDSVIKYFHPEMIDGLRAVLDIGFTVSALPFIKRGITVSQYLARNFLKRYFPIVDIALDTESTRNNEDYD